MRKSPLKGGEDRRRESARNAVLDLTDVGEDVFFVNRCQFPVFHKNPAVNEDGVDLGACGGINEAGEDIVRREKLRL